MERPVLKGLADSWWTFAVRGVIALLFGIGALSYPALTVFVLVIFFGIFVLVDGVTALVMGFGGKKRPAYILLGLVSVAAGVFAMLRPGATALALLWLIGIWALVKGIGEIVAAIQIRKEVEERMGDRAQRSDLRPVRDLRAGAARRWRARHGMADRDLRVRQRFVEADAGLQASAGEEGPGIRRRLKWRPPMFAYLFPLGERRYLGPEFNADITTSRVTYVCGLVLSVGL